VQAALQTRREDVKAPQSMPIEVRKYREKAPDERCRHRSAHARRTRRCRSSANSFRPADSRSRRPSDPPHLRRRRQRHGDEPAAEKHETHSKTPRGVPRGGWIEGNQAASRSRCTEGKGEKTRRYAPARTRYAGTTSSRYEQAAASRTRYGSSRPRSFCARAKRYLREDGVKRGVSCRQICAAASSDPRAFVTPPPQVAPKIHAGHVNPEERDIIKVFLQMSRMPSRVAADRAHARPPPRRAACAALPSHGEEQRQSLPARAAKNAPRIRRHPRAPRKNRRAARRQRRQRSTSRTQRRTAVKCRTPAAMSRLHVSRRGVATRVRSYANANAAKVEHPIKPRPRNARS